MSTAVYLDKEVEQGSAAGEPMGAEAGVQCPAGQGMSMWTTRQVISACLWAALLALLCGYSWSFFNFSQV